jgi:hypothetical protein
MSLDLIKNVDIESSGYHKTFIKIIMENSCEKVDYFKAIQEWKYYGETFEEESNCICGHYIMVNCIIHNIKNEKTLITGNCCINKIGFERKHANKSRDNYLELCLVKCKNIAERDFIEELINVFETREEIIFGSEKEILAIEKISGIKYRYKVIIGFKQRSIFNLVRSPPPSGGG